MIDDVVRRTCINECEEWLGRLLQRGRTDDEDGRSEKREQTEDRR
jgi:hypothetical protein